MKTFLFIIVLSATLAAQPLQEFRAVKLTNVDSRVLFSDANIAEAMDYLASINVNVVIPVVLNRSHTLYPSAVMTELFNKPILPEFSGRDPLERVVIEAHRHGIEVLPWFEYGFASSYSENGGHILARFPDWALRDHAGKLVVKNGFDWMSAIHPDVQDFILALTTEILDKYDVDGIEYSDRIPAMPPTGGYEPYTVALYQAEHNGAAPPSDPTNAAWMRWRADKLNQFYRAARDSIKARGQHLLVSASPSVFPWSYQEYLQDSKTWLEQNIIDDFIPQLYRYNLSDYVFELDKSLTFVPAQQRQIFYSGMLIYLKGANYTITPDFLFNSIKANRARQINGEVYFFYEGLRANNNFLGDTLRAAYYKQPALVPDRRGKIWRPPATIVNEDEAGAQTVGNWTPTTAAGFKAKALKTTRGNYAAVTYEIDAPFAAWFGVYAYVVPSLNNTARARYTVFSQRDSSFHFISQRDFNRAGWQKISDVFLTAGRHRVLRVDNVGLNAGEEVAADAVMLMLNRKLSPNVVITAVREKPEETPLPAQFTLSQNYPNPFNASTQISYALANAGLVRLQVYDARGRLAATLVNAVQAPGSYNVHFDGGGLASGLYFYRLQIGKKSQIKKLVLLR